MTVFRSKSIFAISVSLMIGLTGCSSGDSDVTPETSSDAGQVAAVDSDAADPTVDAGDVPVLNAGDDAAAEPIDESEADAIDDSTPDTVDDSTADTVDDTVADQVDDTTADTLDDPAADPVDNSTADTVDDPVADPGDNPTADMIGDSTEDPVDDSASDAAPTVVSSRSFFNRVGQLPADDAAFAVEGSAFPFRVSNDGSNVLIKDNFFDDDDNFVHRFVDYDVEANSATVSPFTAIDDAFPAFDEAWSTMAYAQPCDAVIQQPETSSEPLVLGSGADLGDFCASRQSAQISDDGDTVLQSGTIFKVSTGAAIQLDNDTLQQVSSELDGSSIFAAEPSLSADGRYVVATVISTDSSFASNGQNVEFSAGTVVIDTGTGSGQLFGLSDYQRFACRNCTVIPVAAPAISGNGQFVFYEQAPEIQIPGEAAESDTTMYRYDIESGEITQVRAGRLGVSEIVVSDSGNRVAWRVGSDVQVAYLDSGDIISLQDGFRFCIDGTEDCLFTSNRFVTNEALTMSSDGSALIVYLIPQAEETSSPDDVTSIMHFDLDTGTLSRVAPDFANGAGAGSFYALSDDGDTVAVEGIDERGEVTIDVLRSGVQ